LGSDPLYDELKLNLQTASQGGISYPRRLENIRWIEKLPREGLEYGQLEMMVPIVTTLKGETLFIQFPGKESVSTTRREWSNKWDFRPKLVRSDNSSGPDLSFQGIWDILFERLRPVKNGNQRAIRALATLFYRMAYMVDFVRETPGTVRIRMVESGNRPAGEGVLTLGPYWGYSPSTKTLRFLSESLPEWNGMSWEAFLHYNNLLAWNEDCKYYFRDTKVKQERWKGSQGTGKVNTLLTHVRVIGFILDEVKPSALLSGFSQGRGVSPATVDEVARICSPYLVNRKT
jgi:hypothetical protein